MHLVKLAGRSKIKQRLEPLGCVGTVLQRVQCSWPKRRFGHRGDNVFGLLCDQHCLAGRRMLDSSFQPRRGRRLQCEGGKERVGGSAGKIPRRLIRKRSKNLTCEVVPRAYLAGTALTKILPKQHMEVQRGSGVLQCGGKLVLKGKTLGMIVDDDGVATLKRQVRTSLRCRSCPAPPTAP